MKNKQKTIKLLIFSLPLFLLVSCVTDQKEEQNVLNAINKEVQSNSKAYTNLEKMTSEIGHRLTGSDNGAEAEEYTYELFKSYGYEDVQYHEFEVEAWARDSVRLEINKQEVEEVVSLGHSPVSADVEHQVIDVNNGLRADFDSLKNEVKGKIALVYIGILEDSPEGLKNIHRSEKTALAIEYGAEGIIIINQVPGGVLLTGTASVTGSLIDIPAICISYEKGMDLKKQLKNGEEISAHIQMSNKSEMIKSRNVIATLPAKEKTNENIILGGHLDSWDLSTGAIDNGIGIAAILDIARTYKALDLQPKRNIKFVMFMGEEQGLLGSKEMVKMLADQGELGNVSYMMNIDMSGNPKGFNAAGRTEMLPLFDEIGAKIQAVDSSYENTNANKAGLHSDHQSFMMEGVPVVGLVGNLERKVYSYYHSNGDDFSLVNEEHLKNTVRFAGMFLWELANLEEIPTKKLDFEQTKDFLIEQGLKEELELGNEWKWGE
ncbi:peptidase M28 [Marivirga tractuosa]|uniref:Carboxypeptidase Q n=1 Tax=Marivirga tractuosa (strain ATCC 23168 / DSM 4126 / NBRC 15989 / NCIMB 1408 / VKM B-1430 / H-43) TaxID=643867 RepID=E4TRE5_MARTH|nr:M20/M25/M40 family metallo-hydrolase [Marivirga tractuosa]ADR20679.1 peptidase M28 [Marivirga tractuosa DSM 4126]BDD14871.1 peptidase M28 [Marivirga tractuosa]